MHTFDDKINLLLVDDETDFLEVVSVALSRRGFSVSTAQEGSTAIALVQSKAFDVVVLDIKMPGIDGVEVFSRIQVLAPDIPVIMLTGHATIQQAFETSRDGVFDYLSKPCDIVKLAQTAKRAALQSRQHRLAEE